MKEHIETAEPRRKMVAGDSDEARKTATGHSCKTLGVILKRPSINDNYRHFKLFKERTSKQKTT